MLSTNRNWKRRTLGSAADLSQIHHVYLTDFPFISLYFPLDVAVVRKGIHNYQPSPFTGETINIWEWWCDNGKC